MIDWISLYASLREMCNDSFLAKEPERFSHLELWIKSLFSCSLTRFKATLIAFIRYILWHVQFPCLSNCNCKVELNFIVSCMYCDEVITNVCLGRSHFTLNGPFLPRVSILHREYARNKLLIIDSLKCQPSPRPNPPIRRGGRETSD